MPVLVSDNTENRCFLDTTFVRMLLPQLRKQVSIFCEDLLVMFNSKKTDLGENLVTQTCMLLINGSYRPEIIPGVDVADLYECGDVRKFLTIVAKSNLFSEGQANVAFRLKQNRELLEKEEFIPDRVKTEVYEDAKSLLESFPGTGEEIDNIERAWAYGVSFFLKRTKTEKEKEQEFDKLRMRCEQAENELRFLKSKNGDNSSQSPPADDLFYSEDEEELDEGAKPNFQTFDLFGSNYRFGLNEAQQGANVGSNEIKTVTTGPPTRDLPRNEDIVKRQDSNWGLGASLQYVDNSVTTGNAPRPSYTPPFQPVVEQPQKPEPKKISKPESKPLSYSFAASKGPPPSSSTPPPPPPPVAQLVPAMKKVVVKEEEKQPERVPPAQPPVTAVEVGYKLNYRQPKPDPRFKPNAQMMMGPLPGHLTHEVAYLELRTTFAARGRVKYMYLSPSFLDHGGRSVKYGYVVFEEVADAQRILKDGFVTFQKKHQIKLKKMTK